LVVIIILTTIVAAAIPIMSPANDDRRIREASRGLNTFITGAQARAIAFGRPYGIGLKRLAQDTDTDGNPNNPHDDNAVCLEVFYVEQPPPFAGFDRASKACVSNVQQVGLVLIQFVREEPGNSKQAGLPIGIMPELFPGGMFRPGDVAEINGTQFELVNHLGMGIPAAFRPNVTLVPIGNQLYFAGPTDGQVATIAARPINDSGQQINPEYDGQGFPLGPNRPPSAPARPPAPYWTAPSAYRILRQPAPTSDEPYQLPEGTAIDLRASGIGNDVFFHHPEPTDSSYSVDNSLPVTILFAPEGRVWRVSFSALPNKDEESEPPTFNGSVVDNLYLLIGKRENIPAPLPADNDPTLDATRLPPTNSADNEQKVQELKAQNNWLNGISRWIVIGSQTGRIATVENAFVDVPSIAASASRFDDKRNQQILAAREFTREMRQLGGR
jgi:hypothetical protein